MPVWLYLVGIKDYSDFQCSDWITWPFESTSRDHQFYVSIIFHAKTLFNWTELNQMNPNQKAKPKTITEPPKITQNKSSIKSCD